jgi:hypothetical protein
MQRAGSGIDLIEHSTSWRVVMTSASPVSSNPTFDWPAVLAQSLMHTQQIQIGALVAWQQSVANLNKELWDEWACHWAGGAPIDG